MNNAIWQGEQCHFRGWTMPFQRVDNGISEGGQCVARDEQWRCTGVTVPRNRCRSASAQVVRSLRTTRFKRLKQVVQSLWNNPFAPPTPAEGYSYHHTLQSYESCNSELTKVAIANLRKLHRDLFVTHLLPHRNAFVQRRFQRWWQINK